jgi:hypothetical protein
VRHVRHLYVETVEVWEAGCEFRETNQESRERLVGFMLGHQDVVPLAEAS